MSTSPDRSDRPVILIAGAKLPDDLALSEYESLLTALQGLVNFAVWAGDYDRAPGYASTNSHIRRHGDPRRLRLLKAQYGSDFMVAFVAAGAVPGLLATLWTCVERMANAAKAAAEAKRIADDLRPAGKARRMDAETERLRTETRRIEAETDLVHVQTQKEAALTVELRESILREERYLASPRARKDTDRMVGDALVEAGYDDARAVYAEEQRESRHSNRGTPPPLKTLAAYDIKLDVQPHPEASSPLTMARLAQHVESSGDQQWVHPPAAPAAAQLLRRRWRGRPSPDVRRCKCP